MTGVGHSVLFSPYSVINPIVQTVEIVTGSSFLVKSNVLCGYTDSLALTEFKPLRLKWMTEEPLNADFIFLWLRLDQTVFLTGFSTLLFACSKQNPIISLIVDVLGILRVLLCCHENHTRI